MVTLDWLISIEKDDISNACNLPTPAELSQLVEWLTLKDDKIRYQAFQMLIARSHQTRDVYVFWDNFCEKLTNDNSYQRSIGMMLLAANTQWDVDNRINAVIDDCLELVNDEKPITARQCIQSLNNIVNHKSHLCDKIADKLMSVDILSIKPTMQKLILLDILGVLARIRKQHTTDAIESYIFNALGGEILDKKSKKLVESTL